MGGPFLLVHCLEVKEKVREKLREKVQRKNILKGPFLRLEQEERSLKEHLEQRRKQYGLKKERNVLVDQKLIQEKKKHQED